MLANNNEIAALSARAAVDYVRRGELSAERYAQVLLDRYKTHTNLNTVAYIDEARLLEDAVRSTALALEARNSGHLPACR